MTVLILPIVILLLGLVLLAAENLLPTGGVLGVLATICFTFLLYIGFSHSTALGVRYLVAELILIPSTFAASAYLFDKTGLGRIAYLRPPETHEVDVTLDRPDLSRFLGQRGRVLTPLRPSGTVEFEGLRFEGIAEQGMIDPGSQVFAVEVRSGRLIVRGTD